MLDYVGLQTALKIISTIQDDFYNGYCAADSIFEVLVNYLVEGKFITQDILGTLRTMELSPLPSSIGSPCFDAKTSSKNDTLLLQSMHQDSTYSREIRFDSESKIPSFYPTPISKKNVIDLKDDSYRGTPIQGRNHTHGTDSLRVEATFSNEGARGSPSRSPLLRTPSKDDLDRHTSSYEDFAVSSYSLKSGAMLDSYSDNGEYMMSYQEKEFSPLHAQDNGTEPQSALSNLTLQTPYRFSLLEEDSATKNKPTKKRQPLKTEQISNIPKKDRLSEPNRRLKPGGLSVDNLRALSGRDRKQSQQNQPSDTMRFELE